MRGGWRWPISSAAERTPPAATAPLAYAQCPPQTHRGGRPEPRRLIAAYTATERPDLFGNAVSQSGSFWWKCDAFAHPGEAEPSEPEAEALLRAVRGGLAPASRFFMAVGLYEGAVML